MKLLGFFLTSIMFGSGQASAAPGAEQPCWHTQERSHGQKTNVTGP